MNPIQAATRAPSVSVGDSLELVDPRIAHLIAAERHRQDAKLIFIASESVCPAPVREALSCEYGNLYAEGYPSTRMSVWERDLLDWEARHHSFYNRYGDRRYYKGCEYVNLVEAEAIRRVTELFATETVPAESIYANVQSLSGAAANNAVYEALVPAGGTVFGMNLSCGGHLTHGSPVNRSGRNYKIWSYSVSLETGEFDYDAIQAAATRERPAMIIAGYSAYPWQIDWARFRAIADSVGARLLADIAHPAGLVAAGEFPSPVGIADVVSFTTHKTLCGPRGAVLLTTDPELARKIDFAVFPGEQGGPHLHAITAKAVSFRLNQGEDFRRLQKSVRANAKALAEGLAAGGLKLAYGGTDTHLCLVDLRSAVSETGEAVSADIAARVLDLLGITCNKNAIAGDTRAAHPNGLRFGTTWASQRGLGPEDMQEVARSVCDLIGSMKAFSVWSGAGSLGRVRVPRSVLVDTRRRIHRMLEQREVAASLGAYSYPAFEPLGAAGVPRPVPAGTELATERRDFAGASVAQAYAADEARALEEGAGLVDLRHAPIVQVSGERAGIALQSVFAGDVLGLEPLRSLATRALHPDGTLLGEFRVVRLEDDLGGFSHYLVVGESDESLDLVDWLRELSDGMVEFDDDLSRKVDGPIVVEDLSVREAPLRHALLALAGPRSGAALGGLGFPAAPSPGEVLRTEVEGSECLALAHDLPDGSRCLELIGAAEQWGARWTALDAEDAPTRCGEAAYRAWRRAHGAGEVGAPAPALAGDETRPYFIGQSRIVTDFGSGGTPFEEPAEPEGELLQTPLHDWHAANTKKFNMVPFAGWRMPVMYTGIVDEHRAVRETAGLFDVAHMGVLDVRGRGAARFLDTVTTNYVTRLRDGDGQYSYTLAPDGHVLDDLLVYRLHAEHFLVVVNASNAPKVWKWWTEVNEGRATVDLDRPSVRCDVQVDLRDLKDPAAGGEQRVDLAFQGPASLDVLSGLCDERGAARLRGLGRFQLGAVTLAGKDVWVARTGYTGENVGFELYVHPDHAVEIWQSILDAGAEAGVKPAGLGARDSTRTEAGFPLYGHELAGDHQISPFGAGYSAFVKWHKPFFVGRDRLRSVEAERDHRILRGTVTDASARPVREGDVVVDGKGKYVGRITSAAYAGGDQVFLFYGRRHVVKRGDALGVFPMPRGGKAMAPEKAKDLLADGDKVLLPIPAQVVPRFLGPNEKRLRSYRR